MAKYRNCSLLLLSFGLCFLTISQISEGFRLRPRSERSIQTVEGRERCEIRSLNAREPNHRVQHEAGVTEMWEQENEQMQCANVAAARHIIEPNGLYLPNFHNAPMLAYIVQGKGILGTVMPGCPETYESFQQEGRRILGRRGRTERGQPMDDQHQKLHFFRQGDILALPAGVAHWWYNDGDANIVMVVMHDIGSHLNQLDQHLRKFYLAGNPGAQAQHTISVRERRLAHSIGSNIFKGFDVELLAESFGVSLDTARQLQCENDQRGSIVRVYEGLGVVRPPRTIRGRWIVNNSTMSTDDNEMMENGLEETFCSMRIRENIEDPERADVYTAVGGRISTITSFDLPILQHIKLSAKRGYLYRNAMIAPQWNMNSHEIIYCIRGRARVQVVGSSSHNSRPLFDGEFKEGQLLVIPQNFASLAMAGEEGFEWITFMTSENAVSSSLSGRAAVMTALPEEVIMNMYMISRQDARRLKYNRREMTILSPRSTTKGIRAAA